jgi:hypothetical protein
MKYPILVLVLSLALGLASCNPHHDPPTAPNQTGNNPPGYNPPNGSTDPINLNNCGQTASTDLIAGQHTVIGKVTASTDGASLTVIYQLNQPNWGITETHLSVKGDWTEIPQTRTGNPIPGQFEFKNDHNKIIGYRYDGIDVSAWSQVSIAAHCKVVMLDGANPNPIPGLVPGQYLDMDVDIYSTTTTATSNFPQYLGLDLSGSVGSGSYDGFCVDEGTPVSGNQIYEVYTVDPFVTAVSELNCLGINRPENFDLMAYVVNQYYAGAYANAQAEELQAVIWTLLEPFGASISTPEMTWDQSVVNAMLTDAQNGEGFIPGLCDYRFFILDIKCLPQVRDPRPGQTTINIIAPQGCTIAGEETAWAFGPQFPGRNWGMYFNYCVR